MAFTHYRWKQNSMITYMYYQQRAVKFEWDKNLSRQDFLWQRLRTQNFEFVLQFIFSL